MACAGQKEGQCGQGTGEDVGKGRDRVTQGRATVASLTSPNEKTSKSFNLKVTTTLFTFSTCSSCHVIKGLERG